MKKVPDGWWEQTCEVTNKPLACVHTDNKFIWVNRAFELLVGYSLAELREMTWMSITIQEDVGGDLASVEAVIKGDMNSYTIAKKYRHKFGHEVPIQLTVWRFPRQINQPLACFIVEAQPDDIYVAVEKTVSRLEKEIAEMKADREASGVSVHVNQGDTHRDNKHNSGNWVKWVAWVFVILAIVMAGLFGYVVSAFNKIPQNQQIENTE